MQIKTYFEPHSNGDLSNIKGWQSLIVWCPWWWGGGRLGHYLARALSFSGSGRVTGLRLLRHSHKLVQSNNKHTCGDMAPRQQGPWHRGEQSYTGTFLISLKCSVESLSLESRREKSERWSVKTKTKNRKSAKCDVLGCFWCKMWCSWCFW